MCRYSDKAQKYVSLRSISAQPLMTGMKRHDLDRIRRLNKSEASVDSRESLYEVEARLSIDGNCTIELVGTPEIQKASES